MSTPIWYPELVKTLGVAQNDQVPLDLAREAVLELRRGKGMLLDPADPDTRSAGSFFTNPVLTAEQFVAEQQKFAAKAFRDCIADCDLKVQRSPGSFPLPKRPQP